ncbi:MULTISPECIES: hypothetical protein [Exiguobacterium]|uniref:hypothetical protein n=1 Tax=Exiguobacterium TaxID=33986 RepID=UPI001BE7C14F|nr:MULTISPECIES: hypothetical protein [Exiguobacterium]MCT4778074.1 hypothetical protein [Exiguobacterium aquaticum]MCT4789698.1 hypothetical protein [Exiguobacterium mexicanum]
MGKLWLIEGLPGSGKTTFAERLATTPGYTFYSEIDASHPVDVHDVYWVEAGPETEGEVIDQDGTGRFIRYRPNERRSGVDVYELPFDKHVDLMVGRWRRFVERVKEADHVYVFECALLQNPFTIGMVAQDVPNEQIEAYIETVADLLAPLDPTVVYLETADVPTVFREVYAERPTDWRHGFVEYYTTRAYAQANGLSGMEGTIQLLEERQRRELSLLERLPLRTIRLVNDERGAFEAFDVLRSREEADHADA